MNTIYAALTTPLQQTRVEIFQELFIVFLGLGTLVGVVVVAYILYNAYKYRDVGDEDEIEEDRPTLGELPTGGTGGKKLFLSFGISAIIVISLVVWSYGLLLDVEEGPEMGDDAVEIDVQGQIFSWSFDYQDQDASTVNELVVPADRAVSLNVTSNDVWHAFGITQQRVKADAIPGEYDETWFVADETGQYEDAIECFELCGSGHSTMEGNLIVVDGALYDAAAEEDALDTMLDGLDEGNLTVDSSPDEFDSYLQQQEEAAQEEEQADDGSGGGDDGAGSNGTDTGASGDGADSNETTDTNGTDGEN